MNLKSLIAAWNENRVQTVEEIIEFLKDQGFDLQKIQSAFKKAGFNIHVHEEKEDNSNVAQDQNPKIKKEDEWFSQGLNDSLKDIDDFDEILSKLTVKDIPIGTQIDHMGKIYTWKGASWVSGGTLAKKEVGASLTHDALTQIAKKKQNEPQIKSTVPGLEVGTMLTGPDNKIYTWKGASWVSSGKFAKKEISQELTKQALSNIQKEQPEIETANQNPETTSGPEKINEIRSKLSPKDIKVGTTLEHDGKQFVWKGASWVSSGKFAKKEISQELTNQALNDIATKKANEKPIISTVPGLEVGTMLTGPDNKIYTWKGASWVSGTIMAKKEIGQELTKQALSNIQKEQPEIETANQNPETTSGPEKINDVSPKVKELSQILLKHAPNAAELLKMNTPLTRLALAILCSPHYQQILDALQKS